MYVAAYAPDEGQSIESIEKEAHEVKKIPAVPGLADPVISDGFIRLKEEAVINYFASGPAKTGSQADSGWPGTFSHQYYNGQSFQPGVEEQTKLFYRIRQ